MCTKAVVEKINSSNDLNHLITVPESRTGRAILSATVSGFTTIAVNMFVIKCFK